MPKLPGKLLSTTGVAALVVGFVFIIGDIVKSQPPESKDAAAAATPPAGQTYVGVKRCSSCHFKQYMSWKKTKHAKEAWETVPAKYRAAAECRDLPHDRLRRGHRFQGRGILGEPGRDHLRGVPRTGQQARGSLQAVPQQENVVARRTEDRARHDLQGPTPQRLHRLPHDPGAQGAPELRSTVAVAATSGFL